MTDTRTTASSCTPATIAALVAGCLLAVAGGYFYFAGFQPVDGRSIDPSLENSSLSPAEILEQIARDSEFTAAPDRPPEVADTVKTLPLLQRGSDSSRWVLVLGLLLGVWGLYRLQKETRLLSSSENSYLQSAYADGIDPATLHTEEDLDLMQSNVAKLHQQKVLWSLPFWFTTLILLVVNKGALGKETILGISDLWLMGGTLAIYVIFALIYWRCPACDASLGKHHDRLTCDRCGLRLVSNRIRFAPLDANTKGEFNAYLSGDK